MNNIDSEYLKQAIENSKKSMLEGNFPAGAIVVRQNEILSSAISSPFPSLFHADSKAVTEAFEKYGSLKDSTLYIGLESCLMCMGVAYWAGIRRIVYAIGKDKVSGDYYETPKDTYELFSNFNEKIELIHIRDLEGKALDIIREWEKKYLKK